MSKPRRNQAVYYDREVLKMTYDKLGRKYGVTRERAMQIVRKQGLVQRSKLRVVSSKLVGICRLMKLYPEKEQQSEVEYEALLYSWMGER